MARATTKVKVSPPGQAPVARDDLIFGTESADIVGNILDSNGNGLDLDPNGDDISVAQINGTDLIGQGTFVLESLGGNSALLTMSSDGQMTLALLSGMESLAVGETDTFTFTYQIVDSHGFVSSVATVEIIIEGENDDPTLASIAFVQSEGDAPLTIDLAELGDDIDSDDDGSTLTYSAEIVGGLGSVSTIGGLLVFEQGDDFEFLEAGETAEIEILVSAEDGNGGAAQSVITVNVQGISETNFVFTENFDRADSEVVGNGWVEVRETEANDPNYTGSSSLSIVDGELVIKFSSEGVEPDHSANYEQVYMSNDIGENFAPSGFALSFTLETDQNGRVRQFIGLADDDSGTVTTTQTEKLIIPGEGIGVEVSQSSAQSGNAAVTIWKFSGDSSFEYENRAADELVFQAVTSFKIDPGESISVEFVVDDTGTWVLKASDGTTTNIFQGTMDPYTGELDQVVVSTIESAIPYGGVSPAVTFVDDIAVESLNGVSTADYFLI